MRASRALYPATLDLSGATVVVLGAGKVAAQKLKGLPKGLARVRVVAPAAHPQVKAWVARHPEAELISRPFEAEDLRHCRLLFCCASDPDVNAQAARQARVLGAWVCQAAEPAQGDLRVPAVIRAAGLHLTLSTGGASPALAKALRTHLESWFKASDLAWVLAQLDKRRAKLKADPQAKEKLLKKLTAPKTLALILGRRTAAGRRQLETLFKP